MTWNQHRDRWEDGGTQPRREPTLKSVRAFEWPSKVSLCMMTPPPRGRACPSQSWVPRRVRLTVPPLPNQGEELCSKVVVTRDTRGCQTNPRTGEDEVQQAATARTGI